MEEGPFRTSRPADRRVVSRQEPAPRQQESPQPPRVEPQPEARAVSKPQTKKGKNVFKRFKIPFIILVVLILGVVGWFLWSSTQNKAVGIDSSKYQAVFFTNGQVYFGKLTPYNSEYLKMTDIYYLQTQSANAAETNPQETTTADNNVQLIKLGDEIHGPEDEMVISKDQVLFYENLKTDGKVAQSIEQFKKSN